MNGTVVEKNGAAYLFQYVLDDTARIVKDELYDYFILRTLYDHAKELSLSKDEIKKKIEQDYHLDCLPTIHYESALKRVIKKKKIIGTEKFTLSSDTKTEIHQNIQNYIDLMSTVKDELKNQILQNISEISSDDANTIAENFFKLLGKTFTIHGKEIARIIVNQNSSLKDLDSNDGFKDDYKKLILNVVSSDHRAAIDNLLNDFLFNSSEKQSKLIFIMVQGHTLLEILNVDPDLQYIQEEALKQTKIYLDTNVVINLLFKNSRQHKTIKSILEQSRELGVTFAINEITKTEFDSWLDIHKKQVEPIRNSPKEYVDVLFNKKIDAPLLMGYLDSLRQNPHQTIDQFCIGYDDITKNLLNDYGIEYDDSNINSYKKTKNYSKLYKSVHRNNDSKPHLTVIHDVVCMLKTKDLRKKISSGPLGPKIWFLTTDTTLWRSEKKIFPKKDIRASITTSVWMQIISPLISPKLKPVNISKAFSRLLSTNFGMDSIIKQEDVLNVSAAFIDDKGLSPEDFGGLLGDKHVRNTLKKLHAAQMNEDKSEEDKWTREGLNVISKKLENKKEKEIEKALSGMTQKLTNQDKILESQTEKITKQEGKLSEQSGKISGLENTLEKKWTRNYVVLMFIAIGIAIVLPIILFYSNLGLTTDNFLVIVGIETACVVGIFVPWKLKHG